MRFLIGVCILLTAMGSLFAEERSFQEQLELAIMRSDVPKVERLLTRKKKLSLTRFNDMLGWADDIIEERLMLDPSVKELLGDGLAKIYGCIVGPLAIIYYFNLFQVREIVDGFPGGKNLLFSITTALGAISAIALYKSWIGPRYRLQDAYLVRYELEDEVEKLQKKLKEQKAREAKQAVRGV